MRTEITFDFHRLGVLLLRAAVRDGALVARKIATATVSEARIQATLGASPRAHVHAHAHAHAHRALPPD